MRWITLLGLFLLALGSYFFITYGEQTIAEGKKFGIEIGQSKVSVYNNLNAFLSSYAKGGDRIFIRVKVPREASMHLATKEDFTIFIEPLFHEVGLEKFLELDRWVFYINADSLDVVELRFSNNNLIEIYRNKRLMELP